MTEDIKLNWDAGTADIGILDGELELETGFESAVLISLFTDARADDDDILDVPENKRGWWGDLTLSNDKTGSRLWLLEREKTVNVNLTRAEAYIEEALQWMLDDEVVSKINVTTERQNRDDGSAILAAKIEFLKTDGMKTTIKYDDLWNAQIEV